MDIHTHTFSESENVIVALNLSPEEAQCQISTTENRFFSIGIHPWDAGKASETDLEKLRAIVSIPSIKLIGECGLDKKCQVAYHLQLYYFMQQIELSEKFQKPLLIHCVGYYNELFELRKKIHPAQRWIIHGFRGKPQLAEQALKAGFDLSFGEKWNEESVRTTPLERLFVETDTSFIAIETLYARIAAIKGCKVQDINAARLLFNC